MEKLLASESAVKTSIDNLKEEEKRCNYNLSLIESKKKESIEVIKSHFDHMRKELALREEQFKDEYLLIFDEKAKVLNEQIEELKSAKTKLESSQVKLNEVTKELGMTSVKA